ncbi:uncharacterized protein LOC127722556 isoform X2 [Mytilus californianus]|nr:uncharacterized protein LOC127722556 isoform X2 [Mytilus californianus]
MYHLNTTGTVHLTVSWQYLKPADKHIRLKGFLLRIEILEPLISRYIVAENFFKGKRKRHEYQLTNINLPEATNASFVQVTVWSLIRKKKWNYPKSEKSSNVDKCRQYTEKYEIYGKSAEFERSKRTIQRTITTHKGPTNSCKCWKDDLSVITTSTDIVVQSSNFCPEDISISFDLFLSEMPKKSTMQFYKDSCYYNFTKIPAGVYTLKILYHCPQYSSDPPSCVKSRTINSTMRLSPQASSYHQNITIDEERMKWLQYTIGIITATFVMFVLVAVFILWHRERKHSHDRHHDDLGDAQHEPLINNQVLLISFVKSLGVATTVSRFEEMINTTFGIKTTNTKNLFNQLLHEESLSKTPENIDSNFIEMIGHFNHVIFVATKDLYESYHTKAYLSDAESSISRNNEDLLHFKLAKIIKDLQANQDHPSIWCHFVAFDKTQNSYCQDIFSHVSPPPGFGRKYRLVRSDVKDLRRLIENLPSSKSHKELIKEITQFSREILVETLQPRNNAIASPPNIPPQPGPSSQLPDRDDSDPSLTEPKSGTDHSTDVKESQGATCKEDETCATYPRSMEQTEVKIVDALDSSTKTKSVVSISTRNNEHDTDVKTLVQTDTSEKCVDKENGRYSDTVLKSPQSTNTATTVNEETNKKTETSPLSSNQRINCTYLDVNQETKNAVQLPVQSNQAAEIPSCSDNEDNDQDTSQELQGLSYIKTNSDIEDN